MLKPRPSKGRGSLIMGLHYAPAFGDCKAWPPSKLSRTNHARVAGRSTCSMVSRQTRDFPRLEGWRVSGGEEISGQGLRVGRSKSTRIRPSRVLDFMRPLIEPCHTPCLPRWSRESDLSSVGLNLEPLFWDSES